MNIEAMEKASHDSRFGKSSELYGQSKLNGVLGEVNCPVEVVILLKKLNQAINLLYCLTDDYYTDYIFNASIQLKERLEKEGFSNDYFMKLADKFELLRSLLYGYSMDFDKLYLSMQDEVMCHEYYWHEFFEDVNRKLRYENEQLKKKEREPE